MFMYYKFKLPYIIYNTHIRLFIVRKCSITFSGDDGAASAPESSVHLLSSLDLSVYWRLHVVGGGVCVCVCVCE